MAAQTAETMHEHYVEFAAHASQEVHAIQEAALCRDAPLDSKQHI